MQGTLAGSIVTLIVLGCFSSALKAGHYNELDAVWRIQIGVALVPAFATLYFRLTMPESKKFKQSGELSTFKAPSLDTLSSDGSYTKDPKTEIHEVDGAGRTASVVEAHVATPTRDVQLKAFFVYFSEWRHLKTLIGTASTWFLVDVAFYGTNLNQSVLLAAIGFSKGKTEYDTLLKNAYGNLIIAAAGYVPGYFLTIYFIEILGRRWIQIQGFLITGLMFGIIAGDYAHLGTAGKFVCFTIAQVRIDRPHVRCTAQSVDFSASALLQLWAQCYHLHCPWRSVPIPCAWLRTRRQCCNWKGRRYSVRCPLQLP